eukprot:TRINITY_DN6977_c0_g1_i1.p1 TRINITY_DN6977_c0_g1~~TRINITY_DN6977_c0_g1_i1.p1  ORF type:complete len:1042 (-),score=286.59 TRINITY_DN6977_c0_g1_i1:47-2791(-)
MAISLDTRYLAVVETTASAEATLFVWEWARGFVSNGSARLNAPDAVALVWLPPGRLVVVTKGEVLLYALDGRRLELLARRASDASLAADFVGAVANPLSGLLYVASASGKLLVLDAAAQLLATVDTPGRPSSIGLAGQRVVVGDAGGTLHIFDAASLNRERSLPFQDHVRSAVAAGGATMVYTSPILALCGHNNTLLVRAADGMILALDLGGMKVVGFALGHFGRATSVCFDPQNPHTIASGAADQSVALWTLLGSRTAVGVVDLPRAIDRRMSYVRRVWDVPQTPRGAIVASAVVFHPAGRQLAVGDNYGFVKLFDTHSGDLQAVVDAGGSSIASVCFSSDGRYIGCARGDGTITLYDTRRSYSPMQVCTGALPLVCLLSGRGAAALAETVDETVFVAAAPSSGVVALYQLTRSAGSYSSSILTTFSAPNTVQGIVSHVSGEYLLISVADGNIYVFHISSGTLRGHFPISGVFCAMSCDPSGLYLAVASTDQQRTAGRVDLYEIGTGRFAGCSKPTAVLTGVAVSADGFRVCASAEDGSIHVWQISGGTRKNIEGVLAAMQSEPQFWTFYPIYLENAPPATSLSQPAPVQDILNLQPHDLPQQLPPSAAVPQGAVAQPAGGPSSPTRSVPQQYAQPQPPLFRQQQQSMMQQQQPQQYEQEPLQHLPHAMMMGQPPVSPQRQSISPQHTQRSQQGLQQQQQQQYRPYVPPLPQQQQQQQFDQFPYQQEPQPQEFPTYQQPQDGEQQMYAEQQLQQQQQGYDAPQQHPYAQQQPQQQPQYDQQFQQPPPPMSQRDQPAVMTPDYIQQQQQARTLRTLAQMKITERKETFNELDRFDQRVHPNPRQLVRDIVDDLVETVAASFDAPAAPNASGADPADGTGGALPVVPDADAPPPVDDDAADEPPPADGDAADEPT